MRDSKEEFVSSFCERIELPSRDDQASILHLAVKNEDYIAVQHLIASGCDVNALDERHGTALHFASSAGLVEMVEILVEAGANVDIPDGDRAQYALHRAATGGHCDIVRMLLAAGSVVDAVDIRWNTSLHCAAQHGHYQVIELLHYQLQNTQEMVNV